MGFSYNAFPQYGQGQNMAYGYDQSFDPYQQYDPSMYYNPNSYGYGFGNWGANGKDYRLMSDSTGGRPLTDLTGGTSDASLLPGGGLPSGDNGQALLGGDTTGGSTIGGGTQYSDKMGTDPGGGQTYDASSPDALGRSLDLSNGVNLNNFYNFKTGQETSTPPTQDGSGMTGGLTWDFTEPYDVRPFDYSPDLSTTQPDYPMPQESVADYTNQVMAPTSPDYYQQVYGAGYGQVPTAPELSNYGMFQGGIQDPYLQYGLGSAGQIAQGPQAGQYGYAGANLQQPQLTGQFDLSNVAQMPVNAGMTGQQALMSRIAPQLQMQRQQLETKLINQGLRPGDEAWNAAMMSQGQQENDAITQAALQGLNLDISANQQGFGQAQTQAQFANQAALSGFGAGLQGAEFGNQAIAQNFSQALQAQAAQNQAQQQYFNQLAASGQFGNEAQLAAFQAQLQNQQAYNQAIGMNQQAAVQQAQLQADLQNQGFSQAQAQQAAQNAAMQQNFANMQTYQQSQNQAAAQAFQQQLAAAQYGNAAQQQAYQQAAMIRQMPINEITALMSGSQIANPAFQAYQGAVAQPGDIQAATGQQAAWDQNIYNQQVASKNALKSGLFGLGSSILGGAGAAGGFGKLFGCWIAEAIYGVDDLRTHLVRAWLNGPFKQTKFGSVVMKLYMKYGERIAEQVKKSKALKAVLKPVFDMALYCAIKDAVKKMQVA